MDQAQAIQRQFSAAAAGYAASAVHRGGENLDAMLALAGERARGRVLDVGCGAGHTALAFAAVAREVVGLDLTPAMLEQARALAAARGLGNLRFEPGDAAALPFADGAFDVVTSRLCAHHYARPEASVREAARVLAPGGLYLLVDSVAPDAPALDTFFQTFELLRDPSHVRNHRAGEWRRMFEGAGLAADAPCEWWLSIDFDDWTRRMATPPVAVAALRALFDGASEEARAFFDLGAGHSFRMPIALVRGQKDG